jgi:hypothetical protein
VEANENLVQLKRKTKGQKDKNISWVNFEG